MTASHERLYLRTLHELVAAGVVFGVLGTFALRCQVPALPRRLVADCDILLPFEVDNLTKLVSCLQAAGWGVSVWGEPVAVPLQAGQLAGKYYLRAQQAGAVLDCAYENEFLGWPDFWACCHWQQGLPLLGLEAVLLQKAQANRPTDQRLLHWI
ncbi:hypothetical protein [Hymenobacter perfusus]|uniref:Nucleotidyltransferase family protein n=1 Tax=Hymenobacter perfusus TaxID=1236770 RepID=A0A3R9PUA6_9BACT|nr:hypothetical protein [Hymenobacter perfusus]RSK46167.1 hypothetical protein EI293_03065 [Hymenobacter perfusus]